MNLFKLRRPTIDIDDATRSQALPAQRRDVSSRHLMPGAERSDPVFVRGQGSWLWDSDGRPYLDFNQGGAVNSLGHSPTVLIRALNNQAMALINPGAGLHHRGVVDLAQRLCESTGSDQAYLLNSGSEACEAAIKLARKWGRLHRGGAIGIITARQGCHGRSIAGLSTCGYENGLPGFSQVPFNDLAALHSAVDAQTVAIILEPIQSEAGVIPATHDYLQGVAKLCRELGILLILDEVQTGMGRCGTLLCEETYDIRADIVVLGKGLGGGVPLAALLARGKACCAESGELEGSHHGNALMTAAGLAVLHSVMEEGFLQRVRETGEYLQQGLTRLSLRYQHGEVRGQGLLWGMQLDSDSAAAVVAAAQLEGLLLNTPQADCLRFSPALTVSRANIDEMLQRLGRAFARARTARLNQGRNPSA
ncbi:aspartate aminotransferase family protein [Pseudomonas sp. Pseusp122]|uniref:aspartate aminotransferase family protein n=1 Tax=unclassified Pseudomonas TaxID=196821 RepID=UPI0039A6A43C